MSPLTETVVVARERLHTEWFYGNEFAAAVLDLETGTRHHLDASASAIWAFCESPTSPRDLVSEVISLGAEPAQAEHLVEATLDLFARSGMLEGGEPENEPVDTEAMSKHRLLPSTGDP